jgi:RimJ/RimL family protein N-acetyltransferase
METPTSKYRSQLPAFAELRGERVLVRPWRESDAQELFAAVVASREHLLPWLPWALTYERVEDALDFILRAKSWWLLRETMAVGLWDASTGGLVGGIGLHPRDWSVPSFEIGYWLRQASEGRGYVTEAVKLLTDYAFATYGAHRVFIRCDARNTRSAAVPERLGFRREAHLRNDSLAYAGVLRDTLIYALTPDDPRWPG